jgi:adenylyltransferase/sulfurtransferase
LSLEDLTQKWEGHGTITRNPYLAKLVLNNGEFELTVFRDGRAIVRGTQEIAVARAVYSRYVGG